MYINFLNLCASSPRDVLKNPENRDFVHIYRAKDNNDFITIDVLEHGAI
jgi:hypothetical protein